MRAPGGPGTTGARCLGRALLQIRKVLDRLPEHVLGDQPAAAAAQPGIRRRRRQLEDLVWGERHTAQPPGHQPRLLAARRWVDSVRGPRGGDNRLGQIGQVRRRVRFRQAARTVAVAAAAHGGSRAEPGGRGVIVVVSILLPGTLLLLLLLLLLL